MSALIEWRSRGRSAVIGLAAGLAAVALVAVMAAIATAAPSGFLHIRSNLSQTPGLVSAPPDIAVSSSGDWVAVAWTEEYDVGVGSGKGRGHVYLRAASETGGGWGDKIRVFTGDYNNCATNVSVAITGTTAHVAYVEFSDTCNNPTQMVVRHTRCSLTEGECEAPEGWGDSSENEITWVDLALDAQGNPHVVWSRYNHALEISQVYYRPSDSAGWRGLEFVESTDDSGKPAIAWADGYAHVVWEETDGGVGIRYARRPSDPGASWEDDVSIYRYSTGQPAGNPDVAAGSGQVFVVWDTCSEFDEYAKHCVGHYSLVYRRSLDRGAHWGLELDETREVGTDHKTNLVQYASSDNLAERNESLFDLQPSIALNNAGAPAVVWHADQSSGVGDPDCAIHYAYAFTTTPDAVGWITHTVLREGLPALGSAVVGLGQTEPGGDQHLHVAYVRETSDGFDVYYDSNEEHEYERIYLPLVLRAGDV